MLVVVVGLVIWRTQHPAKPAEVTPEPPTPSQTRPSGEPRDLPGTITGAPDESLEPPLQSAPPEDWKLPSLVPSVPQAPSPGETPAQSLIRLRGALAKGDYSELPVGTRTRDNSHFFYVSRSTSWQSARRMARAFGGHLAIVDEDATRLWLGQMIPPVTEENPEKRLVWIGATRTAPDAWHWVSSIRWQPEPPIGGSGDFAAIDQQGLPHARASTDQHPFFIQWHRDGSDPTEIRRLLAITGESLTEGNPHFPIGTQALEDRRLLVINEACSYSEALELAEVAGAKLMSAATSTEADWLDSQLRNIDAPNGLWLGATMSDHAWTWNDSQPWEFARWAASSQAGTKDYLLARPGTGWDAEERNHQASGVVLEWSNEAPTTHRFRPEADQREFAQRARELLGEFQNSRSKAAKANADTYLWQLDLWLRRRNNNSEIARWTPRVRTVKKAVQGGRLPSDIPKRPSSTYPGEIHELARHHLKKQLEIDKQFFAKAQSTRDSYVERLEEEVAEAQAIGQREAALFFSQKVAEASDIRAWTKSLGF